VITVEKVLDSASRLVAELSDVFDYIDPCFPMGMRVFHHSTAALADEVGQLFDKFFARAIPAPIYQCA
jgi:hypothetical protein